MADSPKRREAKKEIVIVNQKGNSKIVINKDEDLANASPTNIGKNSWQWLNDIEGLETLNSTKEINNKYLINFSFWLNNRQNEIIKKLIIENKISIGFLPDDDLLISQSVISTWILQNPQLPLAIYFPNFKDGRGYSIAATLRGRFNFNGDLIAFGDVLVDQTNFMLRAGFTTLVLREDQDANLALQHIKMFSVQYQNDWRKLRTIKESHYAN